jgi:hypothetical protein
MNAAHISDNVPTTATPGQSLSGPYTFTVENTGSTAWVSDQSIDSNSAHCDGATDNGYLCPATIGNTCTVTKTNSSSTIKLKNNTPGGSKFSPVSDPLTYSQTSVKTCAYTNTGGGVRSCAGDCAGAPGCSQSLCQVPRGQGGCGGSSWNSNVNCSTSPTYPIYSETTTGDPNIEPNANATFTLNSLTAPSASGQYNEIWQMFQSGSYGYFGAQMPVLITVCPSGLTWNGTSCADILHPPTGTLSAPSCTISAGNSSCNSSLTWSTTNPQGTSSVTSAYPVANTTVATGNKSPLNGQSVSIPYVASPEIFYLYNNGYLLTPDGVSATATCAPGSVWNGSICAGMSGTLTSTSCTIAIGASSCNAALTWSTTNPQGTSAITSAYPVANTTVTTGNSGNNFSVNIPYAASPEIFYLYNNSIQLASSTVTVGLPPNTGCDYSSGHCIVVSSTNGTCGSANGKTYVYGTSSYGSNTQCSVGTSTNSSFPAAGSTASWTCQGTGGGGNASCSASQNGASSSPGVCGTKHYNCSTGTSGSNATGPSGWTWTCTSGTTVSCSQLKPVIKEN